MKDSLGDRMKSYYEDRFRMTLPRRAYTLLRIDGKAFHTYTRGSQRPFDEQLVADMDSTAIYLCQSIQGAVLAFVQSDEISILLTDFAELATQAWFDGNVQKMVSISASYATAKFNELRPGKLAYFDSRVFQIPTKTEVINYLIWRQQDTVRNSISSVAQSLYSSKELHGKSSNEQQELIFQKGINWNDYPDSLKRGRLIIKNHTDPVLDGAPSRSYWESTGAPTFTANKDYLNVLIPDNL